jgi:protein-L-isoaspartate(D-aspartate) O-methyltransferase
VASAVSVSPSPDFTIAREAMIDSQLKPCGVVSPRIVSAFFAIPREDFVAEGRRGLAYVDSAQALGNGRELMPPLSLGLLVEDASPQPADNILVVGAATGYSAAVLSELAGKVTALESDAALAARARAALAGRTNVEVVEGPLEGGAPAGAPYSLILIDGAVQLLPPDLIAQLAEGGRLYAILQGTDGVCRAARGRKQAGVLPLEPFAEAAGAILPPFRKAPAFRF